MSKKLYLFVFIFVYMLCCVCILTFTEQVKDNMINTEEFYEKEVMFVSYDSDIFNLTSNISRAYNEYIVTNKTKPEQVVVCLENGIKYSIDFNEIFY